MATSRYDYAQENAVGIVDNDAASLEIVDAPADDLYLYIQRINISVYEPAAGGGGILDIKNHDGDNIYKMNVDGVKDILLDFGDEGYKGVLGNGVMMVVSGGATKQAGVSIQLSGYYAYK